MSTKKIKSTKKKSRNGVKDKADLPRKDEVDNFVRDHGSNLEIVQVDEMRHIIPLIRNEVDGRDCKKAHGTWSERPPYWPKEVPFHDPNNNMKGDGMSGSSKPLKDTCLQMLRFLVQELELRRKEMLDFPHGTVNSDSYFVPSQGGFGGSSQYVPGTNAQSSISQLGMEWFYTVNPCVEETGDETSGLNTGNGEERYYLNENEHGIFNSYGGPVTDGLAPGGQSVDLSLVNLSPSPAEGVVVREDNCIPVDLGGVMGLQQVMETGTIGDLPERRAELGGGDSRPSLLLVEDVEDYYQGNLLKDSTERIDKKLAFIGKHCLMNEDKLRDFNDLFEELRRHVIKLTATGIDLVHKEQPEQLINLAHNLERDADLVLASRFRSSNLMAQGRRIISRSDGTKDISGVLLDMDSHYSKPNETSNQMIYNPEKETGVPSSLNIKCRPNATAGHESLAESIHLRRPLQENSTIPEVKSFAETSVETESEGIVEELLLAKDDFNIGLNSQKFSNDDSQFFDSLLSSGISQEETERDEIEYEIKVEDENIGSGTRDEYWSESSEAHLESHNSGDLSFLNLEKFSSFSFSLEDSSICPVTNDGEHTWEAGPENHSLLLKSACKQYENHTSRKQYIDPFEFPAKSPSAAISQSLAQVSLDSSFEKPAVPRIIKRKLIEDPSEQAQGNYPLQTIPTFIEGADLDDACFNSHGGKKMKTTLK